MANIVVTTHYTWGDVLPFIRLCARLKKRGHEVTLITHGAFREKARDAGADFAELDAAADYHQLLKDICMMGDPINDPDAYIRFNNKYHSTEQLLYEYNLIAEQCISDNTVLVARHRSEISAYLVSEKLGIPLVPVFLAPSYIYHLHAQNELIGDIEANVVNPVRKVLGLPPVGSWYQWMCSVKKCIGLWPEWFAGRSSCAPFSVTAAGFPLEENAERQEMPVEVEAFINAGEAPILITGGTSMLLKASFYRVAVEACRILKHRAILVCEHRELVPEDLPEYIKWYDFLPLDSILPRMKLIIHHGGIGTIGCAAYSSVPQLALAADTDRPDNATRIRELGIGEYLPPIQWQPDVIAEKLRALTGDDVRRQCSMISAKIKSEHPLDLACDVIERAVGSREMIAKASADEGSFMVGNTVSKSFNGLSQDRKSLILSMLKKKLEGGIEK